MDHKIELESLPGRDAKEYDADREEQIRSLGITIIRFKNKMVYGHLDEVIEKIREVAQTLAGNKMSRADTME